MRGLNALLIICLFQSQLQAQTIACCPASSTESFAQFASDRSFVMSHPNLRPYIYKSQLGKSIVFKAADGRDAYGFEIRSGKPSNNYVFVIHEWWGLNDDINKESARLWADLGNANIIAIDLYDGKVAANREDASKLMSQATSDRIIAILKGAIAYVGPSARIFSIGWCFGGGWSLQASLLAGDQADGCVMYYGMPEKDLDKLKILHADVLGIFANKDQWINPKLVDEFEANMKKAGKKLIVKRYEADHAFANPSNPSYDKIARESAYGQTLAFLKERLK
jgi:carboxymethylenebutenolidase